MTIKTMLLLAALLPFPIQAYEMEDVKRIDFEVRDPDTKELFLNGYENITQEAGSTKKEAWYHDLQKAEVQYEFVLFNNASLRVDSYRFKNGLTGEESEMQTQGEQIKVKYRESSDKAFKDGTMSWEKNAYHGKVFNNLILRHWQSLLKGQPLKFDLVLPSHFKSIGFQIVYKNSAKIDGEDREIFALQPTSLIIRAIVPRMEFHYTKGDKPRIRQFTGPCSIPIKGKKDKMVDIVFSYPKA